MGRGGGAGARRRGALLSGAARRGGGGSQGVAAADEPVLRGPVCMGRGLRGRWRWEVPSAGVALFVSRVAAFETRKLPTGLDRDGGGGRAARVTAAAEFPGKRWLLIPVVGGRTQVPARRVGGGAAGRCPPRRRGGVWGSTERWPTSSVTAPRVEQERGVATTRRACKRGRAPGCSRKPHASVARVPRARPGPGKHVPHSPFTQYRRRWLVRQRPMTQ